MGYEEFKKNVCAGIVTYNPEINRFYKALYSILPQVDKVYIYDNGSKNYDEILASSNMNQNIELIHNKKNEGIAHALQCLCSIAIQNEYEWLLTLDHDTVCPDNIIESYFELITVDRVGIICPRVNYVNFETHEKGDITSRYSSVWACMTSGSLMSLSAYSKTPGFDDWMFIDYVDNDICIKLKIAGFNIIRDNNVFIDHKLGNVVKRKVFLTTLYDFQYSDTRIYYIVRNLIFYRRKYFRYINRFKYDLIIFRQIFIFFLLYHNRSNTMSALKKGFIDGKKAFIENCKM